MGWTLATATCILYTCLYMYMECEIFHGSKSAKALWSGFGRSVARPIPAIPNAPTPQEVSDVAAYDLRAISAYQETKYCVGDSAKSVLGKSRDPKIVWDILERRFGSRQEGLQESLINKLRKAAWDVSKMSILTHRDTMFDLRTQLADTGMVLSDESFPQYFTHSPALAQNIDIKR